MAPPAIETFELTKRFGAITALDKLTLSVEPGEVFGFLGPNGAGKTTTIRLLLGLLHPSAGSARIFGTDVSDVITVHRRVAYVPGDVALWPQLTGAETLELLANLYGGDDPDYRARLVEMLDLDVSRRVRTYSKGNRQKVALIAALATRADLLLLDEPTSGLDPLIDAAYRECVRDAVQQHGTTVFLSSHILTEVESLCRRVAILRAGKLAQVASLDELRAMRATVVDASVPGPIPDLSGTVGVISVEPRPGGVRVQVRGSVTDLLRTLSRTEVTDISVREPTLEDIFLSHYGQESR